MPSEDDLTPNISTGYEEDINMYPLQPEERTKEEQQVAAVQAASYPIMAELVEWFDDQIDLCDSRRYIGSYATAHNILHTEDLNKAFDILRELLEIKSKEFEMWRAEP